MVEPTGLEFPEQSSHHIDRDRDLEENITKEDRNRERTIDPSIVDLLENQHDNIKYIEEYYVNLPELDSNIRVGR